MSETRIPAALRRAVVRRAAGRCEYCRSPEAVSAAPYCVDHIVPERAGGKTESKNLAFACYGCNGHKGSATTATDPAMGNGVPLFNPRQQRWSEHFAWSSDWEEILGLTPVGRATVAALAFNRAPLRNLRRLLRRAGELPPEANVQD